LNFIGCEGKIKLRFLFIIKIEIPVINIGIAVGKIFKKSRYFLAGNVLMVWRQNNKSSLSKGGVATTKDKTLSDGLFTKTSFSIGFSQPLETSDVF